MLSSMFGGGADTLVGPMGILTTKCFVKSKHVVSQHVAPLHHSRTSLRDGYNYHDIKLHSALALLGLVAVCF